MASTCFDPSLSEPLVSDLMELAADVEGAGAHFLYDDALVRGWREGSNLFRCP